MWISDRLTAITTRADEATEGPWDFPEKQPGFPSATIFVDGRSVAFAKDPHNAEFIAHAKDDVPWLVEQVRKRDAALQAVRDLHIRDEGCGNPDCCDFCEHCLESWPCPTVRAIEDGLREDR